MNEYPRAAEWLVTTLTGIAGVTGIYAAPAPQDATFPCITFDQHASADLTEVGAHRIWNELTFLVAAATKGASVTPLEAIADAIDTCLHRTDGTTTDGRIVSSVRLETFYDRLVEDGVTYVRLGGLYQLLVQPLNV